MKLILRIMIAIVLCAIASVIVDIIGIIWLVVTGELWILFGLLAIDVIIFIAGISKAIVKAHEKGIYLKW